MKNKSSILYIHKNNLSLYLNNCKYTITNYHVITKN